MTSCAGGWHGLVGLVGLVAGFFGHGAAGHRPAKPNPQTKLRVDKETQGRWRKIIFLRQVLRQGLEWHGARGMVRLTIATG